MRQILLMTGFVVAAFVLVVGGAQAYDAEFDYNADGTVDQADVDLIQAAFGSAEGDADFDPAFDHDQDGFVTGADVVLAVAAVNN